MNSELSEKLRGFERVWERVSGRDDKADEAISYAGDCADTKQETLSASVKSKAVRFLAGGR